MVGQPLASSLPLHTPVRAAKASPSDVRRSNRSLMFSLLFPSNRYSRAELGRRTGLSRVAVSDVVADMIDEGLIRESGVETNATGKGKRGTLLGVDGTRLRIVSVDLSGEQLVQGAVTDLLGVPERRLEITLDAGERVDEDMIVRLIDRLCEGIDADRLLGIGVSMPGVVQDGTVRESTFLGWRDVDLRTMLSHRFGLPVTVGNDATNAMLAERFFGQAGPNLLFVKNDYGIGSATLIDDVPVTGEHHASGEIGHISIDPVDGPPCPCGKRGCMELLISAHALRERMHGRDAGEVTRIIREAGGRFAAALSVSIGLLDIRDVCVTGPADVINETFLEAAQKQLDATTASPFTARTAIRRCQCGPDVTLRGGAIAVVRDHLDLR